MLARLRRFRIIPLFLLLLLPGVGGTALQGAHSCAAMAAAADGAGRAGHHHHHGSGAPASAPDPCRCVGSCHHPVPLPPLVATVLPVAATVPVAIAASWPEPPLVSRHPFDHRPPSTAPPAA
ncbi:MAG: hypothetical protein IPK12_19410 [Gemmatimonadetes bacterium]|nr:hypothetical protein [Gemmatimonadota bacterium]